MAYRAMMKQLHPDVKSADTTAAAVEVIEAYRSLMGETRARLSEEEESAPTGPQGDIFDFPEGPADAIFVDPFACLNVDPSLWRELQQVVRSAEESGRDPFDALTAKGVSGQGAVTWLTQSQLSDLEEELELMEKSFSYETSRYYVQDCLLRASGAYNRGTRGFG